MIDTSYINHVPFSELPIEAQVLFYIQFYIQSMAAWK
jgi:hypothetical protein